MLQTPLATEEVFRQLSMYHKDHIWTVINFWVDEGKITIEKNGSLLFNP
ncbi:hypothetical protein KRR40_09515 [Niabella defluvii]|nr:hypothetical protein KRR40_09515 [Niabella sp. I65]